MIYHWLEDPNRSRKQAHEHINPPRISADVMVKLQELRNKLTGANRSLYEENLIAEENKS